jgi:hypothetical protein
LPFDLQFQFELFDLGLKLNVLLEQPGISLPLRIELSPKHPEVLIVLAGSVDERSQCSAAKVRTVADLRAGVFMFGEEAKLHWHLFLRMPNIPHLLQGR